MIYLSKLPNFLPQDTLVLINRLTSYKNVVTLERSIQVRIDYRLIEEFFSTMLTIKGEVK